MDPIVLRLLAGHAIFDFGHALVGLGQFGSLGLQFLGELLPSFGRLLALVTSVHRMDLKQNILLATDLAILPHERLGLALGTGESVLLLLGGLDAVELLLPHFREGLDPFEGEVGLLDVFVAPDDVLQVLQQSLVVFRFALGGHHADHLDLSLQDQEAVVVEIDALGSQEFGHLFERGVFAVDLILARVVATGHAAHDQFAPRHDLVIVVAVAGVDDLGEVHADLGVLERIVLEGVAAVDQFGHLVQPQFLGALAEDEEHGVDDIAFAGTVRTYHGGEAFVEWADGLLTCVGFEVF
mmetsp:Transcript_13647/g.28968  ORF Transcript_13647/g.28968 Transcript_13647/m.28968 type:complete len:296 (-) Transcript_13647:262-1149(-)